MSETETAAAPAGVPAPAKKGGALGMVLPAILAAAAAFGGAKIAGAHAQPSAQAEHHAEEHKPPGPTVPLDPFLVTIPDANKKSHPMKVTLAIEFESTAKEEAIKAFAPRIRDAALSFLRTMTYEQAVDPDTHRIREDLLERVQKVGATTAERILITDLVTQ
jgi:flagellar basal body-associated protein FliL